MRLENGVLTNMKVAVTEACANVVVHAYERTTSQVTWSSRSCPRQRGVTVVVRDEGRGFRPTALGQKLWRLGMPLIASLDGWLRGRATAPKGTAPRCV